MSLGGVLEVWTKGLKLSKERLNLIVGEGEGRKFGGSGFCLIGVYS